MSKEKRFIITEDEYKELCQKEFWLYIFNKQTVRSHSKRETRTNMIFNASWDKYWAKRKTTLKEYKSERISKIITPHDSELVY